MRRPLRRVFYGKRQQSGRLGGRALPQVMPFEEEVTRAFEAHQIVAAASPNSPAAVQYHRLAEALKLAADPLPLKKAPGAAPLLAAAAALLQPVGAGTRAGGYAPPSAPRKPGRSTLEEISDDDLPSEVDLDLEPDLPSFSGMASVPAPSLTLPAFRPPPSARIRIEPAPMGPDATPARTAPKRAAGLAAVRPWLLGVGLAVAVGIGLRFIELPKFMMPIAVGLAVTAAVVLAMRVILTAPEEAPRTAPKLANALTAASRKKEPPDLRKESPARYPVPKRPAPSGSYRRPRNK